MERRERVDIGWIWTDFAPGEAHRLADWIADYLERSRPLSGPFARTARATSATRFRRTRPSRAKTSTRSSPTSSASSSPASPTGIIRASSPTSPSPAARPAFSAEFLSAALNQQAMLWRTSPAATELEEVVAALAAAAARPARRVRRRDLRHGVGLDAARARRRARSAPSRTCAAPGSPAAPTLRGVRVYCSEHAHSSVDKAVILLGLGHDALRAHSRATRSTACARTRLAETIARRPRRRRGARRRRRHGRQHVEHQRRSRRRRSRDLRARERVWLHVDAAYAGVAAMVPGYEWILRGARARRLPRRQSAQVAVHAVRSRACSIAGAWIVLRQAFSLTPEYLKTSEGEAGVRNLMDTGHPARTAIPRAEALDGPAALRRGRTARASRGTHAARATVRGVGRRERSVRTRRARPLQRRLLPPARRMRMKSTRACSTP